MRAHCTLGRYRDYKLESRRVGNSRISINVRPAHGPRRDRATQGAYIYASGYGPRLVPLVPLVPLEASRSIGSAVAAFEDSLGRISALACAHATASAVLATGIAGVGNDLKFAGFD